MTSVRGTRVHDGNPHPTVQCFGRAKRRYESPADAEAWRDRYQRQYGKRLGVYRCKACAGHHLTSVVFREALAEVARAQVDAMYRKLRSLLGEPSDG